MAQTQAQWYAKISKFVPSWFFEKGDLTPAVFQAIAAVFQGIEQDTEDQQTATFITKSVMPIIDLLGDERSVTRQPGESNIVYGKRIQSLLNQANPFALLIVINALLIKGTATLREHGLGDRLFVGQSYLDRGEVFTTIYFNTFSIIIDRQIPDPNSFMMDGMHSGATSDFFGQSYVGTDESSKVVFDLLVETINNLKAAGTLYRVFERSH